MRKISAFTLLFLLSLPAGALAWHFETHLAICKAAGYKKWYNCTAADLTKEKAGTIEDFNHWFNNSNNVELTPELIKEQALRYNSPNDPEGHLYGAIVSSLREYDYLTQRGSRNAVNNLAFFAHYAGDLSQPLHNLPYDQFNRTHHGGNDGAVENDGLEKITKLIKVRMKRDVQVRGNHFEADLIREIIRMANQARALGRQLKKENSDQTGSGEMSRDEAYRQLAQSADLIRAVLLKKDRSLLMEE